MDNAKYFIVTSTTTNCVYIMFAYNFGCSKLNIIIYISFIIIIYLVASITPISISAKYQIEPNRVKSHGVFYITLDILNILTTKETDDIRLIWNKYNYNIRSDVMKKIISYHLSDPLISLQLNPRDHAIGYVSIRLNLFDNSNVKKQLASSTTAWLLTFTGSKVSNTDSWFGLLEIFNMLQPHIRISNTSVLYQLDLNHKLGVLFNTQPLSNTHKFIHSINENTLGDTFLDLSPSSCLWKNRHSIEDIEENKFLTSTTDNVNKYYYRQLQRQRLDGYYFTRSEFQFIPYGKYNEYTEQWVVNDKYESTGNSRRQKSATEWYRSLCADAKFYKVDGFNSRICTNINESTIYMYKTAHQHIISSSKFIKPLTTTTAKIKDKKTTTTNDNAIDTNNKLILCLDFDLDKSIVPTSFLYDEDTLEAVEGLGLIFDETAPGRPFIMIRENFIDKNDDDYDDDEIDDIGGDGYSNKNVIIWGKREIDRYVDYFNYNSKNNSYIVVFCGQSASFISDITSDMLIDPSMIPEIDWWRGIFIIIIITLLLRRSLSRNNELQLAVVDRSIDHEGIKSRRFIVNNTEWEPILSPHLTILAIDPFIYLTLLISGIWYIIALAQILPPAPTYVTFWLWVSITISSFILGIVLLIIHYIYSYRYSKSSKGDCFADVLSHTIIGSTIFNQTKTNTASKRPVSVAYIMILRGIGYIVGLSALIFALWWDTDDSFHWGLVSVTLFISTIYLIYHALEMWMIVILYLKNNNTGQSRNDNCNESSFITIIYVITISALAGLSTGYSLPQIVLPFLQSVNGAYTNDVVIYGMWITFIFAITIVISMIHGDLIRIKNVLISYSREKWKSLLKTTNNQSKKQ